MHNPTGLADKSCVQEVVDAEMTGILNAASVVGTCTHGRIFVFGGNINIHGLFSLKSAAQGLLCRALAIGQCVTETGDHV